MSYREILERSLGIKAYPFKPGDDGEEEMDMPNAIDKDEDYTTFQPIGESKKKKISKAKKKKMPDGEPPPDDLDAPPDAESGAMSDGEAPPDDLVDPDDPDPSGDEIPTNAEPADIAPEDPAMAAAPATDPSMMGGDPSMGGMGGDPSMGGMGGMEDEGPTTSNEVGRIYELKKIFARLSSVESYLSSNADPSLITLRNYVSKGIELFRTFISNLDLFKEKLDEIVIMFYKFVHKVYKMLADYYKTGNPKEVESLD